MFTLMTTRVIPVKLTELDFMILIPVMLIVLILMLIAVRRDKRAASYSITH